MSICNSGTVQLLDAPPEAPQPTRQAIRWWVLPVALLTGWATLAVLATIPVVVNMINTPQQEHTLESALRIGAVSWAALFATPFDLGPVHVTLMPWGVTLVVIAVFWSVGSWMVRACAARVVPSGIALVIAALLTGMGSGIVGQYAELGDITFRSTQVGAFGFAMATIGMGIALLTGMRGQFPPVVRGMLRGGVAATFALAAVGAILILVSFLRHITVAQELLDVLQPTPGSGALITGLQIAYLPVFLVWAISYLTGAGFLLGAQTVISPFIAIPAPIDLPPLPLLAAVPTAASPAAWAFPVIIVLVGALSAQAAMRRLTGPKWFGLLAAVGMAAVAAGIVTMVSVMSQGALGIDRLATLGPAPQAVGMIVGGLLFVGALPRAVLWARA